MLRSFKRVSISLMAALLGIGLAGVPAQAVESGWGTVAASDAVPSVPRQTKHDKVMTTKKQVRKNPPPVDGPRTLVGTPYWYSGAQQNTSAISPAVTSVGTNYTDIGNTYLDTTNDAHTLVESAVRKTNNSNVGVVEAGIAVNPGLFGNSSRRLFVYYWDKNGNPGGYNTNFTLYASRTYSPGDIMSGTKNIKWVWDSPSGDWWLAVDNTWVGYYEDTTVFPSFTFNSIGQFLSYGEVAQNGGGSRTFTCTDTGVGLDSSNASASSSGSTAYNGAGTNVSLTAMTATPGSGSTVTTLSARTFRYGGPGRNSTDTGAGTQGSC